MLMYLWSQRKSVSILSDHVQGPVIRLINSAILPKHLKPGRCREPQTGSSLGLKSAPRAARLRIRESIPPSSGLAVTGFSKQFKIDFIPLLQPASSVLVPGP
jgi:hypothetical protein